MHGHDDGHLFGHVHVSFVIYNKKESGCEKININCRNKVQRKLLVT